MNTTSLYVLFLTMTVCLWKSHFNSLHPSIARFWKG